ncbi:MAG: S8 family serine peptidase [Gammaproteobacteria bacterium]|nr:S8 family serine peptidase [Gammaproteobacteria bacterium]
MSTLPLRPVLKFAFALIALLGLATTGQANSIDGGKQKSFDQFIVQFEPGSQAFANSAARQRALAASVQGQGLSVSHLHRMGIGADVIKLNRKLNYRAAEAYMNRLRRNPNVKYVEIDRILRPTFVPNDSFYAGNQWHYFEATGGIGMPAAWDLSTGSGVVVAVLDTGITTHSDLAANLVAGYDFIKDITTARDGNGRDSDPSDLGDWVEANGCADGGPAQAEDSSWHGTHVAGTIAAVTNNAKGVAGIAYNAKVMPLRVLGRCGGLSSDISDAVYWAAGGAVSGVPNNANPVEVINMSLGGEGACGPSAQAAIDFAVAAGAVVVISAGNDNADTSLYQPANCANVIVVGATTRNGAKSSFSNFGTTVDVSAPGGGDGSFIVSTWNDGLTGPGAEAYIGMQGTSMSAPHVAGTAALMQSLAASSPAAVESVLKSTARALPVPCAQGCGTGIINALSAVAGVTSGVLTISDVTLSEGDAGTKTFNFTVNLSKAMGVPVTFDVATTNGSATAGSDYVALSLPGQSIAAGATSKIFSVTVNGDTTAEADETFTVNVSNVVGIATAKTQGLGTILNDDTTALSNGVAAGPIAGAGGTKFLYSLVVPSGKTSVTFTTTGGTGDADLYAKLGSIPTTVDANCASEGVTTEETCAIPNPVAGTYYVLVYAYSTISGVTLTGQYLPGDAATLSVGDVVVTEGNSGTTLATFPITLSQSQGTPVTFDVYTDNGTAGEGADYVAKALQGQSIAAGQTLLNFTVSVNGDTAIENNETFTVNLVNASGAPVSKGQGLGRINNDDAASLSIADVLVNEGNSGTGTATFVVRLSAPLPNPVSFNIATSNGTATAGSDYVARSQTGKFMDAGRTTQAFDVVINGDVTVESTESFNVTISNVSGATLADGSAVALISNDDGAVAPAPGSFSAQGYSVAPVVVVDDLSSDRAKTRDLDCASEKSKAEARRRGRSVAHCRKPVQH